MLALEEQFGRTAVVEALREEASAFRGAAAAGRAVPEDVAEAIVRAVPGRLAASRSTSLRPAINATGVIVHTNLGRAPLSAAAIERVAGIAGGYSNLEYDLAIGERGKRDVHADRLVPLLTGAEGGIVVNNNAAATLITLAALAAGREVIVSRGELVEIGGGFRVPDVMSQSGAILREVGTTNRTRAADYAAATSEKTALILRVHPSNFRMEGFVERPRLAELVAVGRKLGVPLVEDQGSGYLGIDVESPALRDEPSVRASIADGADLVMFSADKLLGGPQAGIIAGRHALLTHIRRHPLMRALRADKMTYAALEATLQEHAAGRAPRNVPVVRMLTLTEADIETRAVRIIEGMGADGVEVAIAAGSSTVGGGSAPGSTLPTRLLAISHRTLSPADLEARLRAWDPPIVARVEHDRLLLDLRTVLPDQDDVVLQALSALAR
jgi:L-seryl-tRNA(Ser) seleniumtransferase